MYRIQSVNRFNKEFLIKYPEAKERIIRDLLVAFANEMYKNKCFEITETNIKAESNWMRPEEQEIKIEAFVMTPKEFKEAIETLRLIKDALPIQLKGYVDHLHHILINQPID